MKAVVYYAANDIRVEDRPAPQLNDNNMIAKVKCCALCGTDLKIWTAGNPRCHPPRILGHEMIAGIEQVGKNVKGFSPGEKITFATTIACNDCAYCAAGLQNVCPNSKPISYDFDGGLAEYIEVPAEAIAGGNVIKLAEDIGEEAALCEPLSCAINSQEIVGVKEGDFVLVTGGGPLGAMQALLAKANGAKRVALVGSSAARLKLLDGLEGVELIDGSTTDVEKWIFGETNGLGADVVIVCAPVKSAMENALNYARKGGGISYFASLPSGKSELNLDSRLIHYKELHICGASDSRPEHVQKAAELIGSGKIDLKQVISHRLDLEEIIAGLTLMKDRQCLKVVLYPGGITK